jgi:probable F420-dependent oxidoreductase
VGEKMTEVAGEVADGMLVHAFTTASYLTDVTLPALERGFARAGNGKSRASIELSMPAFVVTGVDEQAMADAARGVREQIAFYGSTPAYRGVLEHHGWGDLQPELNRLSKQGAWKEMGDLITDDIVDTFAVVGPPSELPRLLLDRWGGLVDRLSFYAPYRMDPGTWADMVRELKAG